MKRWLASLPIRIKLVLLAIFASAVAVFVAFIFMTIAGIHSAEQTFQDHLHTEAAIVARACASAIARGDAAAAERQLQSLAGDPAIAAAEIRLADGSRLAGRRFGKPAAGRRITEISTDIPGVAGDSGDSAASRAAGVSRGASASGGARAPHARLLLAARRTEIDRTGTFFAEVQLGATASAILVAVLAGLRVQRLIADPLVGLERIAATVSRTHDFSLRARAESDDEIGRVVSSFNEMLGEIEARDRQLRTYRTELEATVSARTAELAAALADARAAVRAKADFVANMSHEIRTPMNGVIGMLSVMDAERLDPAQRDMLVTARSSAESLLALINDILDFSKMDAGKLTLERVEVELRPLAEEVAMLLASQAHAKGVAVVCDVHGTVPTVVLSDPTRLRQIMVNLLGNAVKFTLHGEVRLALASIEQAGEPPRIEIAVSDTGIGMDAHTVANLFQAFTQADSSTTRRFGGSGLGLTITRHIVQAMGGSIRVESERGRGSTFIVTLPVVPVAVPAGPAAHAQRARGAEPSVRFEARVLLVEDNAVNQKVAQQLLRAFGLAPRIVENGAEAVRLVGEQPFDLILMDCQMPVMDGYEATRHIRTWEQRTRRARIPIIAMTAAAMPGDRERCLAADMDDYVTKPIGRPLLGEVLSRYLPRVAEPPRAVG